VKRSHSILRSFEIVDDAAVPEVLCRVAKEVQERARRAYRRFQENPHHPGLRFKKVHDEPSVYAVRISQDHRALGALEHDQITWFWIGSHEEYERLLEQL